MNPIAFFIAAYIAACWIAVGCLAGAIWHLPLNGKWSKVAWFPGPFVVFFAALAVLVIFHVH